MQEKEASESSECMAEIAKEKQRLKSEKVMVRVSGYNRELGSLGGT